MKIRESGMPDEKTWGEFFNPVKILETLGISKKIGDVAEFGCGFGRITKLVLENFPIKRYVAFDLSPDQIPNAKKNCNSFDVDFHVSTIQDFEYKEKFDLVFGSEVLLHVKPSNIHKIVLKQLMKYTS